MTGEVTYRLPDDLGGGDVIEVRPEPPSKLQGRPARVVRTAAGTLVAIAADRLTPVGPPLPPEPPSGSVVECNGGYLHIRRGSGMAWSDHREGYSTWAEIVASHDRPLVRLVPDPFAEPVELPWSLGWTPAAPARTATITAPALSARLALQGSDPDAVLICVGTRGESGFAHLSRDEAREMARALWAAAGATQ